MLYHPEPVKTSLNCLCTPQPRRPSLTYNFQLLPALVLSLGGPNANMPRLQAAAAAALITFCNPARMQGEWLYAEAPAGLSSGGGDGGGAERRAIGAVLLEALCELVRGSPSVVVREEALTAVGCVAQVSNSSG